MNHELIKPIIDAPGELPKSIPLPLFVENFITSRPKSETLISEMAVTNPIVFLHSLMVAESYRFIRMDYINRIAASSSPAELYKLNSYLASFDMPVFFHDFGKWLLDPNADRSAHIINTPPPEYFDMNIGNMADSRPAEIKALHKIHTLTGGLGMAELYEIEPSIGLNSRMEKELLYGLHEKLNGNTSRPSYPRSKSRVENRYDKLVLFLAQLSDTAVAMGQPRSFRPFRLRHAAVYNILSEFIDQSKMTDIFGPTKEGKAIKLSGSLMDMTFSALRKIQEKYPEPTCFSPPPFTIFDHELSRNTDYLPRLAKLTWKKYEQRLKETLEFYYRP